MSSPAVRSILLVDDDEISNLFNKIFIGKLELDIVVDVALNGVEAVEFLKGRRSKSTNNSRMPFLLLLDIRMPIMDGWQFLDVYDDLFNSEVKSEIAIVMLTTSEDEGDMIRALDNPNIREVIKKPLSESKFNDLIKKFGLKSDTT